MSNHTAVLLMAHGAPESVEHIPAYLQHIMKGRPPSDEIIAQVKERYQLVGGKSPLLEITTKQALSLEKRLNQSTEVFKVFIGMRHWHPFIDETVQQMASDPPERLLALSLAPQYSTLSVAAYIETLNKALSSAHLNVPVQTVKSWYKQPDLIEAFCEKIKDALNHYEEDIRKEVHLLFTAHSLPESVLEQGDPYPQEVEGTVKAILKNLDIHSKEYSSSFAYQSQGFRGGKWLGPEVEKILDQLASKETKHVLLVPIGFVCDHVEILYDVDILFKDYAKTLGITLRRTASLNDSPRFIDALVKTIHAHL